MLGWSSERGDTLIEVLLATAILAIGTVGAFAILNRGTAAAYSVLERTETRAKLSQQLELVTYFRDRYNDNLLSGAPVTGYPASVWGDILARAGATNSAIVNSTSPAVCNPNSGFYLQRDASGVYSLQTYGSAITPPTTPNPGQGLWLEAVRGGTTPVAYVDVFAKSCWQAADGLRATLSSVTRLYDR